MKSLMEEASTLIKAIENAWNRAGKPQEFSVKILEYPETGFLGLTTVKSAKIALFFTESAKAEPQVRQVQRREGAGQQRMPRQQDRQDRRGQYQGRDQRDGRRDNRRDGRYEQRSIPQGDRYQDQRPEQRTDNRHRDRSEQQRPVENRSYQRPEGPRPTWSPDMVNAAQEWLKETLVLTGLQDANVKSHVSQSYLKLIIDKPVSDDPRQEELLLKSWSNLAYDALQEKFNTPLHGLRLVIEVKRN